MRGSVGAIVKPERPEAFKDKAAAIEAASTLAGAIASPYITFTDKFAYSDIVIFTPSKNDFLK